MTKSEGEPGDRRPLEESGRQSQIQKNQEDFWENYATFLREERPELDEDTIKQSILIARLSIFLEKIQERVNRL